VAGPLLIYDGHCRFCARMAMRLAARWPPGSGAIAVAGQDLGAAGLERLGLSEADVSAAAWWINSDGTHQRAHLAIAAALVEARGWRRVLGTAIRLPVVRSLAAAQYVLIARNRRRLPVPRLPSVDATHALGTDSPVETVEDPDWTAGTPRLIIRAPSVTTRPVRWVLCFERVALRTSAVAPGEQVSVASVPELEPWMDSDALRLYCEAGVQATCIRPLRPRTRAEHKAAEEYPSLVDQGVVPVRGGHRVIGTRSVTDGASGRACEVVVYQDWSELLRERTQHLRARTAAGGRRG
jgi:predicted DCC family thiol-disulfide oxidoreductase YuxK